VAFHTKDTLRRSSVLQIFNLFLAIPTLEARRAEGLVSREDRQILDLIAADTATVGAIITNERSISEQEEIGIRVQNGVARVAPKTVYVPSIAR